MFAARSQQVISSLTRYAVPQSFLPPFTALNHRVTSAATYSAPPFAMLDYMVLKKKCRLNVLAIFTGKTRAYTKPRVTVVYYAMRNPTNILAFVAERLLNIFSAHRRMYSSVERTCMETMKE